MKKIVLFFGIFICQVVNVIVAENIRYINKQPVIAVKNLLKIRPDIISTQLSDSFELDVKRSPLFRYGFSWWEKDIIIHPERFVLSIPHGSVYSQNGLIIVDNMYVDEFIWSPLKADNYVFPSILKLGKPKRNHSKIAVITQGGINNYYHWMVEVLPKLAMLQESGIAYDYLYLPLDRSYMKETIQLLGIDVAKIIQPTHSNQYIQADELIVPSRPSAYNYLTQFVINFLREKFIPLAQDCIESSQFAKRIFISRRGCCRRIMNEDELFALFQEHGFVRYNLEELSILEQVALFHNAEFIVGEHGAGLTNIIFAQPGMQVLEIFQARKHMGFWYLCQELGLQYNCVKTIEFDERSNLSSQFSKVIVPLDPIKNIIHQILS